MPKKPPRYSLSVQRDAAEQVIVHHRPIAQVVRQLRCSPQSVKNWIDKHQNSPLVSPSRQSLSAFLPIQVAPSSASPSGKIELVTKNGLILRFPLETSSRYYAASSNNLKASHAKRFPTSIYIATAPVDMRKSFDGLSAIVKNGFKKDPLDGAVNIASLETVTDFSKKINKESSLRLCLKIGARHPNAKKIHLFLDNGSYYTLAP